MTLLTMKMQATTCRTEPSPSVLQGWRKEAGPITDRVMRFRAKADPPGVCRTGPTGHRENLPF
jgi:hypothetical protein